MSGSRGEVAEAWADWIAGAAPWDWFVTGTFAPPGPKVDVGGTWEERQRRAGLALWRPKRGHTSVGYSLSDRRWREWVGHLEAQSGVDQVYWLRARERHQFSRSTHFHALVGGVGKLSRREAFGEWFARNGQARIVPVVRDFDTGEAVGSALAVVRYVTKYVLKDDGEVVFSDNAGRWLAGGDDAGRPALW